jgi:hypothetical protein
MDKISYAVKVNSRLVRKVKEFCVHHGMKQGFFVEKALREQLDKEEFREDVLDLKNLHHQEVDAISFEEYLKKRAG